MKETRLNVSPRVIARQDYRQLLVVPVSLKGSSLSDIRILYNI